VSGACSSKLFIDATSAGNGAWDYAAPLLKQSLKGKIKKYTLFARSLDADGNVESTFSKGRNANAFEIK
jgi:hypothetical protein